MTNWIIYINGNEEANVKKRLVAGILGVCTAGAIALSGCGANSNEVVATLYFGVPEAAATTEADATSGSVEVETEDLFTSTELANIDKEEVSLGLANFMIRYQQANYDTNYLSMFGKDMWSQDLYGTGSTFGDDVKDDIMSNIENMLILEHHMDEYNVKITEEDEAKFAEVAKEFMDSNKRKAIKQMGATEEYIEEMLRLYTINDRMYDAIVADVDTDVKDSEISQKTITLVQVDKNSTTDDDGNETTAGVSLTSDSNTYYLLTAGNVSIAKATDKDSQIFATTTAANYTSGVDAADLVVELQTLQSKKTLFRGGGGSSFLQCIYADVTVDTQECQIFTTNFQNIQTTISQQRMSVSGVDEDEEALDLIKFQNAYNLASKCISVFSEIYDRLILNTGV